MPRGWRRLSHSGRGLGEYVPFVGVMPAAIPESREEFDLEAGVIVLATGFRTYQPRAGRIRLSGISRSGHPAGIHPPGG